MLCSKAMALLCKDVERSHQQARQLLGAGRPAESAEQATVELLAKIR